MPKSEKSKMDPKRREQLIGNLHKALGIEE